MPYNYRSQYHESRVPSNAQEQHSQRPTYHVQQQPQQTYRPFSQIYSTAQRRQTTHIPSALLTPQPLPTETSDNSFTDRFLRQVEEYDPVIPIEVTRYFMQRSGLGGQDDTVAKLISIATQKFISDIILDAREQHRLQSTRNGPSEEQKITLTPELLETVLRVRGIEYIRPPYYE